MKKMKTFESIVRDICAKTRTKVPTVVPYKLRIYTAWYNGDNRISYHPIKVICRGSKYLLHIAAHEVGHVRCKERDRTTGEYKAELFALKTIKKHYPKYFTLKFTKETIKENKKWYGKAFKRALREFERIK